MAVALGGVALVLLITRGPGEPDTRIPTTHTPPPITSGLPEQSGGPIPTASSPSTELRSASRQERLARLEAGACDRAKTRGRSASGAVLRAPSGGHDGGLRVVNGTDRDAAVFLVEQGTITVAGVFVRASTTARLDGIPDGRSEIQYAKGAGWLPRQIKFCEDNSFHAFDALVSFRTTEEAVGDSVWVRKTIFEITLHTVAGGTARTHGIPPERFAPGLTVDSQPVSSPP